MDAESSNIYLHLRRIEQESNARRVYLLRIRLTH